MVRTGGPMTADPLRPAQPPRVQTFRIDPAAAGQDPTCAQTPSCGGPGARTSRQKVGGVALLLALAALILARIYGVL